MPSNTQLSSFFFFFLSPFLLCFSTLFDYSLIKRLGLRMWHFLEELIMHHINLLALDKDAAVKIEVCINAASIWTAIIVINSRSGEWVQLEDTSCYIFHSDDSRRIQCVFQQSFLSVSTDPFIRGLILISDLWILLGPGFWMDLGCIPPWLFPHYPF